ncbi:GbsR/MarR family transcriptional regulator [Halobacillus sp. H74]|uniref:GbsR/MarR family transcriptional regulator n=1 Tax=Halobacillus sp. H74 TaxID=3457436 RepID=UPI003FCE2BD8
MVLTDHHTFEDIHTKVMHEFSKTLEMFGLTPADARLFVTLYLHKDPMTLDDMSEALGKSKTSMSTGVRGLLEQGLVERVWKKGFRKDLYQANENLYKNFMSSYIQKWQIAADEQKETLKSMEDKLEVQYKDFTKDNQMQLANDLYRRMEDMIQFHEMIAKAFYELDPDHHSSTQ